MPHSFRTLLNLVIVLVLATAGIVRGEIVCIADDGRVAVEAAGECEDHRPPPDDRDKDTGAPCVDIPIEQISASLTEGKLPQLLPPQAVLDVARLVTPAVTSRARVPLCDVPVPPLAAPLTQTTVLLI